MLLLFSFEGLIMSLPLLPVLYVNLNIFSHYIPTSVFHPVCGHLDMRVYFLECFVLMRKEYINTSGSPIRNTFLLSQGLKQLLRCRQILGTPEQTKGPNRN